MRDHISDYMRDTLHALANCPAIHSLPGLLQYLASCIWHCAYLPTGALRPALADNLSARPPEITLWYPVLPLPSISVGLSQQCVLLPRTVSHLSCALCCRGICPVSYETS